MSSHSGAAILAIFDRLRHDILGQQSKDLNGKPLTPIVYSHLPLGKMIDPKDLQILGPHRVDQRYKRPFKSQIKRLPKPHCASVSVLRKQFMLPN